ncbi:uncharacterized protein LOC115587797 [Sparus aurata]|uniref:uncharacterized protein LOC115587797 n=1 Tax=Sparus aurata TaxID=8175 RepID=UPI0011C0E7AC|nr:uncharacterized protein LOC115587797 [Sparus aurata]
MAGIEDFVASPCEEFLDGCTKDQLLKVAESYDIVLSGLSDKRKGNVKSLVKMQLIGKGVLVVKRGESGEPQAVQSFKVPSGNLTFEQQKELLLLQLAHEKDKQKMEMERQRLEFEKQVAIERLRRETEQAKIDLQATRLGLVKEGKLSGEVLQGGDGSSSPSKSPDMVSSLRLLPKFNEKDPDVFFSLFERLAEARGWSDSDQTLLLQCVLTGKAQEAYASLGGDLTYKSVKAAVLKAYELVPEAYRQRFRTWEKRANQSHMEFVRELTNHFNRWCVASSVDNFEGLCNLVILEQFKDTLPSRVATYLNERKVTTAAEAAGLADEYVIVHKGRPGEPRREPVGRKEGGRSPVRFGISSCKGFRAAPQNGEDVCNYCREAGHWKSDCPMLKAKKQHAGGGRVKPAALAASVSGPVDVGAWQRNWGESGLTGAIDESYLPFISDGFVSLVGSDTQVPVKILRDTGAFDSYVLESVLCFSEKTDTGDKILMRGMGLDVVPVPVHKMNLDCELGQREVLMGVRPALPIEGVDIILGNDLAGSRVWAKCSPPPAVSLSPSGEKQPERVGRLPVVSLSPSGPEHPDESAVHFPQVFSACVVTRAMSCAESKGTDGKRDTVLPFLPDFPLSVSHSELQSEQRADRSLDELFGSVLTPCELKSVASGYFLQDGILVRKWMPHGEDFVGDPIFQVVVPLKFRGLVLKLAHDGSGHLGVHKTYDRILRHFFWPRLKKDVSLHIKNCSTCQLTGKPNQVIKPAPLQPIPAISQPFEYLLIDCVGPLPKARSGCKYLLSVMCQSTRYPAAYPLRTITARAVVRALTQFVSVFGIPRVIQSDQGSNFSSHLLGQVLKLLGIGHNQSSAYHAQSQGALERFHQTLKSRLRAYCTELDGDWEDGLPWLLLAAREVVQESTGFSPNDLVFGHTVRGPLSVFKDGWKGSDPPTNLIDYVNGFRHRLYTAGELAKQMLATSQAKMKKQYDRRAELREFSEGDRVLALCPLVSSPFQAKFMGPYTVVKRVSDLNYLISTPGRRKSVKLFHVNLLKPYYAHSPSASVADQQGSVAVSTALVVGTVGGVLGECLDGVLEPDEGVLSGRLKNSETLKNLKGLVGHLPEEHALEFEELIFKYPCLFGDVPSRTDWAEHDIDVGETLPIRQHFYRVSPEKRKYLDAEVKYMLENNIAVPSFSSWASPCLLVPKSDGTPRFCSDFRKVNKVTKPDSFPLPRMEDCVDQVDASHVGAGAVLVQADEQGVDRPVSFFSKKFNRHQVNYSVVEKEALALVWALQHFAVYVESGVAPVVVYTDHNPLTFLHSLRCPNQRLIRWSLFLQSCNLDIRHIKGRDNVVADALSRAPVME